MSDNRQAGVSFVNTRRDNYVKITLLPRRNRGHRDARLLILRHLR
jgi:hypothetical protein